MGWRLMVKQQKHGKVFAVNFQFNFRAKTKRPVFCHPGKWHPGRFKFKEKFEQQHLTLNIQILQEPGICKTFFLYLLE